MRDKDPAAATLPQVFFLYPGFHVLIFYKVGHWFYKRKHFFLARMISQWGRGFTNIEIHPGATIGEHLFIDHGAGVVIGETAEVGNNVMLYHGVTLGGTGKDTGKRHPTVQDDVLIGAGAKLLGPIVIGKGSRIGANSTVLHSIEPYSTAVGTPAVVVSRSKSKTKKSANKLNETIEQRLQTMQQQIDFLEEQLKK